MDASAARLRSEFPRLPLSQEWLIECVEHLRGLDARFREEKALVDAVRLQFLASDLRDSLDGRQRDPRLVQVLSITDVGVSAYSLLEALRGRESDPAVKIPRGMLRIELCDGVDTLVGYEHTRIDGLSIDTPLGIKLLLRSPPVREGVLLLTPDNVDIIGGVIPELSETRLSMIVDGLCSKLGIPVPERPMIQNIPTTSNAVAPAPQAATPETNHPAERTTSQVSCSTSDINMDVWDVEAERVLCEAEAAAMSNTPTESAPGPTPPLHTPSTQSVLLESLKDATPVTTSSQKIIATPSSNESLKIPQKSTPSRRATLRDVIVLSSSDTETEGNTITISDSDS